MTRAHKQEQQTKLLFIDDRFIEEQSGLRRCFHQAVKCDRNPIIRAEEPWEKDAAFIDSGLAIYDKEAELFKAWYQGGGCYGPEDGSNMCYATSRDGVDWDKPSLGQVEHEGSKDNNIVLLANCMMHDPAVIIDHIDSNPQRRYKAVWWGGRKDSTAESGWQLGHCVGFSPDGIQWCEHPENPVWPGDAEVAVPSGLERTSGKLVMYNSADGYGMRVTARSESDDFVHWDLPPQLVFGLDEEDPPGTEMAGLAAIDYEDTHLGMLWLARNLPEFTPGEWRDIVDRNIRQGVLGPPIEMNNTRCRTMHTELVTSVDGIDWHRCHREPLIPFGPQGSWDECIALAARPFAHDGKIWLYYTGIGRTKPTPGAATPEKIAPWNVETGLATLRLDGFASLQAGSSAGVLVTKEINFEGTDILVNADAGRGTVKLALLDEQHRPITGYTGEESQTITGDQIAAPAAWKHKPDAADLRGRRIRLKLHAENAQIYSVSIQQ